MGDEGDPAAPNELTSAPLLETFAPKSEGEDDEDRENADDAAYENPSRGGANKRRRKMSARMREAKMDSAYDDADMDEADAAVQGSKGSKVESMDAGEVRHDLFSFGDSSDASSSAGKRKPDGLGSDGGGGMGGSDGYGVDSYSYSRLSDTGEHVDANGRVISEGAPVKVVIEGVGNVSGTVIELGDSNHVTVKMTDTGNAFKLQVNLVEVEPKKFYHSPAGVVEGSIVRIRKERDPRHGQSGKVRRASERSEASEKKASGE